MSEYQLLQIMEGSVAQMVVLIGQIIAINFAMVVAIYYFLNRAGIGLKLAAFFLYTLGCLLFLLLAVRQSTVSTAAAEELLGRDPEALSAVSQALLTFRETSVALVLNVSVNLAVWALWVGVILLLFIWKRREPE